MTSRNIYLGAALMALLAGCSLAPATQTPDTTLPQDWAVAGGTAIPFNPASWWEQFNQPQLGVLIAEAFEYNSDLQLAAARVAEARASVTSTTAERFPLLEASAGAERGNNNVLGQTANIFNLGGLLSYEVDLWGRLANANRAARARLLASEANAEVVRQALAAEVARLYFTYLALDWQVDIARRTIQSRQDTVDLQRKRFDGGDIDALSFRQAEAQLAAAQALMPTLAAQREQVSYAMTVLLGRSPNSIIAATLPSELEGTQLPSVPPLPQIALADHLVNRPDLRAAEYILDAANADIGVARTAYLPRLSLSALAGLASADIDSLFDDGSDLWSVGASAGAPVLDFGRARAQVAAAEARQKQAYINYEQTARIAVREVMDNLSNYKRSGERLIAQNEQIIALREAVDVARKRYDAGYSDYLEVLDAERNLLQVEIDSVTTQNDRLIAMTNLYRALGHRAAE